MKLVALCGKAGVGKDTILHKLVNAHSNQFNKIINCTTRPPREGEKNGLDYYFLNKSEFKDKVKNGDMLETTEFNDWYYGALKSELSTDKVNVGVFNLEGIRNIMKNNSDIELYTYYIYTSGKNRLLRQLNREECPDVIEIVRRFMADERDFSDMSDIDCEIVRNSEENDVDCIVDLIFNQIC